MDGVFFERLHPANITPDMLTLIEESKKWDEEKVQTEEILGLIAEGHAQLWYFEENIKHGILLTQVFEDENSGEKYVFIWRFYGKGFLFRYELVEAALMDFARSQEARSIRTYTHAKGEAILCAHGFHKVNGALKKEVN
jgi:hypothetical protein